MEDVTLFSLNSVQFWMIIEGRPTAGAVRIESRFTQEEIAQMIGVSRESANRLISSFAGRGWIDWNAGNPSC